jgi:hypothetical protein
MNIHTERIGPTDGRQVREAAAEVVIDVVRAIGLDPSTADQWAAVIRHPVCDGVMMMRQKARTELLSPVSEYFDRFAPGAGWRLRGTEQDIGAWKAHIVWCHDDGHVLVHHIKPNPMAPMQDQAARARARQRALAAADQYGAAFRQLTVCVLSAPAQSFAVGNDGEEVELRITRRLPSLPLTPQAA